MNFDIDAHNKKVQEIIRKHYKSLEHDLYKKVVDISIQVAKSGDLIQEVHMFNDLRGYDYKPYRESERLKAENEKLRKCVKFYASEYSWITKMIGVCDLIHEDDLEQLQDSRGIDWNIGGKFARQTLEELK